MKKIRASGCAAIAAIVLGAGGGCGADASGGDTSAPPTLEKIGQTRAAISLEEFYEKYTTNSQKGLVRLAVDAASLYTTGTDILSVAGSVGTLLGLIDAPQSLDDVIRQEFGKVNQKLDTILLALIAHDWSQRKANIEAQLGKSLTAANSARDWVRYTGTAMPTLEADAELQDSGSAVMTLMGSAVFERAYHDSANDGEPTVTDGTVTPREWKFSITKRPPHPNGLVFEWRLGLPALMHAINARLTVLAAVYPNHIVEARFRSDLLSYRDRLIQILSTIEGGFDCGWSLWRVGGIAGTYTAKAICAETYTGIYATEERTGPLRDYMLHPVISPQNPYVVLRPGTVGSPGVQISSRNYCGGGGAHQDTYLCQAFWDLAPTDPLFGDLVSNGIDDAMAKLRRELGLFEVRKMIDRLYAMAYNNTGPAPDGRIRSAMANRCLGSANSGDAYTGIVNSACVPSNNLAVFHQAWRYDPLKDSIQNWWNNCVDVQWGSSRIGTPVWLWGCNGGDAQRWSYDAQSHLLRNALGRVLDVQWGNSNPGTPVWTWDQNDGPAQQWGFQLPFTSEPPVIPPICTTCQ